MNNLRKTYEVETANIFVRVYVISNKSGSAKQPESDEVTDNIYVAVSEIAENPRQSLFVFKNVFGGSDISIFKGSKDMADLSFTYLKDKERRKISLEVTIDGIVVNK